MLRNLWLAAICVALSTGAGPTRAPVLVELFTSEGCSSCPPADLLLQELDPQTIVLSEHVDYWDRLGWRDPFSSHAFTERQQTYARRFRLDGAYTPQMVVDGAAQFVGSDSRRATEEIGRASRRQRVDPRLMRTPAGVHVEIDAATGAADVMLALADDAAVSQVAAGENQGRKLHHVAVVRSLRKIGTVKRGASFRSDFALPAGATAQRIVVFLQESGQSQVSGAALLPAAHQ
jgi:hypothetical protein